MAKNESTPTPAIVAKKATERSTHSYRLLITTLRFRRGKVQARFDVRTRSGNYAIGRIRFRAMEIFQGPRPMKRPAALAIGW
jgi:hypothetical protein